MQCNILHFRSKEPMIIYASFQGYNLMCLISKRSLCNIFIAIYKPGNKRDIVQWAICPGNYTVPVCSLLISHHRIVLKCFNGKLSCMATDLNVRTAKLQAKSNIWQLHGSWFFTQLLEPNLQDLIVGFNHHTCTIIIY